MFSHCILFPFPGVKPLPHLHTKNTKWDTGCSKQRQPHLSLHLLYPQGGAVLSLAKATPPSLLLHTQDSSQATLNLRDFCCLIKTKVPILTYRPDLSPEPGLQSQSSPGLSPGNVPQAPETHRIPNGTGCLLSPTHERAPSLMLLRPVVLALDGHHLASLGKQRLLPLPQSFRVKRSRAGPGNLPFLQVPGTHCENRWPVNKIPTPSFLLSPDSSTND